jgi:Tol biopolymer transport system component/DNA-binding winged helix-turn-helix (wHTH) protein
MMASKSFVFRFDDVEVREREFTLIKAGKVLTVEPKAFRALLFLLHNPQRLISKEELLDAVWDDAAVTEGSLTRCISLLRSRLGDDIRSPRYIETVATVGYRFKCTVEVSEEVPSDLPCPDRSIPEDGSIVETLTAKGLEGGLRASRHRWPLAATITAGILASFAWYLHRPLPPPSITGYSQITHDGHQKVLVGTDGARLYFNQMSGPSLPASIAEVAIPGGGTAQVPVPIPDPLLLDVSPDGSDFLIYSNSEALSLPTLWNVRILGGSKRRLTEIDGDSDCAAFSPDGNSAAYAQQGDIYVVRSDGTEAHKLVSAGNDVSHIVWSPDGGAIRFTMKDRIWEVSSNGSGLHGVIPGWHGSSANCCGRWTSDGKFFLFLSDGQIWALDERRGLLRKPPDEPIQLTQGPINWGRPPGKYPTWAFWGGPIPSKDGSKIFALGFSPRGELSRFDSMTKQFQPFLGGISAQGVVFSKDGKSIAYVSYPEGSLWKADRDGSNPVQLTDAPIEAILPRWSPDGKLISFALDYPGPNGGFYVVSANGGSPRKILPEDRHMDGFLTWSPDGHRMVGTSTSPDGKRVLRILNLDTRQATTIPGSDGLFSPRWSPDGRYVAAASWDGGHLKIFDFKTQQWSELPLEGIPDSPEWSADGQYIYFRRVVGDLGLFRIRIHGGTAEKIADLKDFHDAGWLGRYMGLDPTDAPLLLRDVGSSDIYALTLEQK